MIATIISIPSCNQCRMAEKLCEKFGIEINKQVHITPIYERYPIIYFKGNRLNYDEFLQEIKKYKKEK